MNEEQRTETEWTIALTSVCLESHPFARALQADRWELASFFWTHAPGIFAKWDPDGGRPWRIWLLVGLRIKLEALFSKFAKQANRFRPLSEFTEAQQVMIQARACHRDTPDRIVARAHTYQALKESLEELDTTVLGVGKVSTRGRILRAFRAVHGGMPGYEASKTHGPSGCTPQWSYATTRAVIYPALRDSMAKRGFFSKKDLTL